MRAFIARYAAKSLNSSPPAFLRDSPAASMQFMCLYPKPCQLLSDTSLIEPLSDKTPIVESFPDSDGDNLYHTCIIV